MPQFSVTPAREKILARIPDYAVGIEKAEGKVRVTYADTTIAESTNALLVKESRHGDVYYIPRTDVSMTLFTPTDLSTYCPFKGHASYWSLSIDADSADADNIVWSYESPYPEVEALKDHMSFYTDRTSVHFSST